MKKENNSEEFNDRYKQRFFTPRARLVCVCVIIVSVGIFIGCLKVQKRVDVYQSRIDELSTEVKELEKENEDLEEQMDHINSDEYLEQLARERLGMIKKGESVLKQSKEQAEDDSQEKK